MLLALHLLPRLRALPLVVACLVAILGLAVLAGWLTGNAAWVQVRPGLAPVQGNSAVGFLLCGIALAGLYLGWRRLPEFLGASVAVLAALTLSQYLLGIDLGIDQALFEHSITVHTSPPGRMAPNAAVAFLASGLALVLLRRAPFIGILFGSVVVTLGAVALLGYVTGVPSAFAWGRFTHMALLSTLGFSLLGIGLIALAFERQRQEGHLSVHWTPCLLGAIVAIAGILYWHALRSQEIEQIRRTAEAVARGIRNDIVARIDLRTAALMDMAERGALKDWRSPAIWNADVPLTVGVFPDLEMIEWIDTSLEAHIIAPSREVPRQLVNGPESAVWLRQALEFAQVRQQPVIRGPSVVVGPFLFEDGGKAFRILLPLFPSGQSRAYLSAVFSAEKAFKTLPESIARGYNITVLCWNREVFRYGDIQTPGENLGVRTLSLDLPGQLPWQVIVSPQAPLLALQRTALPEVVLGASLLIALLLGLTLRFAETAMLRAEGFEAAVRERTAELELENTERRRAEEALQQKTEQLTEADRRKSLFLTMLGHELRNPLGSIRNALGVLDLHPTDATANARMQEILRRQVSHLARLVDDLLDVSRIERGKLAVRPERLDLVRLVGETLESERVSIQAAGLTLEVELPEASLWVDADPTRLAQVIGNLLSNAKKFTAAGGKIAVRVTADGEYRYATVAIRDTGCGVDLQDMANVFDPFIHSEAALHPDSGGLGLGLPIAKGLIEAHGGRITAFSEGPDRGSEFAFQIPLQAAPIMKKDTQGMATKAAAQQRILVIDDQPDSADALGELLTQYGHQVEVVYDGPSALGAARRFHPDVVICDIGLPGMDGYQVAEALRRITETASIQLIALTGYGDGEAVRRAHAAGFDYHVTKPVDLTRLRELIAGEPVRHAEKTS